MAPLRYNWLTCGLRLALIFNCDILNIKAWLQTHILDQGYAFETASQPKSLLSYEKTKIWWNIVLQPKTVQFSLSACGKCINSNLTVDFILQSPKHLNPKNWNVFFINWFFRWPSHMYIKISFLKAQFSLILCLLSLISPVFYFSSYWLVLPVRIKLLIYFVSWMYSILK